MNTPPPLPKTMPETDDKRAPQPHAITRASASDAIRYCTLFEASPNAIMLLDANGFIDCNPATLAIFAAPSVASFTSHHPADFSPPLQPCGTSSTLLANQHIATAFKQGATHFEWLHQRADGREFPAEVWLTRMELNGTPALQAIVRDLSKSKQLQHQVNTLSSALQYAGTSVLVTDRWGVIEYVNPAFEKLTGYSAQEAIGQTPKMLNSGMQDDHFYAEMWSVIKRCETWSGRIVDRKKDGSLFPATLTISPIMDAKGESPPYRHLVGIHSDLSKLEKMEDICNQAQKMDAIGTMVGGIAHDFNNLLSGLTGNLFLAKRLATDQPKLLKKLENIEETSQHAMKMIHQLLSFSRKSSLHLKPTEFKSVVETSLNLLQASLSATIALHSDLGSKTLPITGDDTQLHQVLMNLINNARDAVAGVASPTITVTLSPYQTDDHFLAAHPTCAMGIYAHLSVHDNGCGIPQAQIKKLFEPFFTTKAADKGTGLGLAMVFGAIQTHRGIIDVESVEGEGTTFHLYIPLCKQDELITDFKAERVQPTIDAHKTGTILLVDDQEIVLDVGKEILKALGHQVITAKTGSEAVATYLRAADTIDLCIMDIVMPNMCGDEAARQIRATHPEANIIFATGYDKSRLQGMEKEIVLNKPFPIETLDEVVQQQLQ